MKNIARYSKMKENSIPRLRHKRNHSLTICNVARGRIDSFIDFGCSMEGQAAAALILKNAGGKVFNYDFSEWDHRQKGIVATNGVIDLQKYRNDNRK